MDKYFKFLSYSAAEKEQLSYYGNTMLPGNVHLERTHAHTRNRLNIIIERSIHQVHSTLHMQYTETVIYNQKKK